MLSGERAGSGTIIGIFYEALGCRPAHATPPATLPAATWSGYCHYGADGPPFSLVNRKNLHKAYPALSTRTQVLEQIFALLWP